MARILLIEDDDPLRSVVREILAARGHAVTEAANGREALTLQAAGAFDLLILDIVMPEQDGLEVLQALRARGAGVKTIVTTGGGRIGATALYLTMAARLGAHRMLQKPFSSQVLLQAVDELCPATGPDRSPAARDRDRTD